MDEKSKIHLKSEVWQIYLPLFLGSGGILALGVWATIAAGSGSDIGRFADISALILIIPVMVFALIPLVFLGGLIYGLGRLAKIIPGGTRRALKGVDRIQGVVETVSEGLVRPILRVAGFWAGLSEVLKRKK